MKNQSFKPRLNLPFIPEETPGKCWQHLTTNANILYHDGEYSKSLKLYETAYKEADDLFLSAQLGAQFEYISPAPMLVTSATNLAENQARNGKSDQACQTLASMINRLTTALNDPGAGKKFVEECAHHLSFAVMRLTTLMHKTGAPHQAIADEIEKSKQAFFSFASKQTVKH